jgi:hypothetical protein
MMALLLDADITSTRVGLHSFEKVKTQSDWECSAYHAKDSIGVSFNSALMHSSIIAYVPGSHIGRRQLGHSSCPPFIQFMMQSRW